MSPTIKTFNIKRKRMIERGWVVHMHREIFLCFLHNSGVLCLLNLWSAKSSSQMILLPSGSFLTSFLWFLFLFNFFLLVIFHKEFSTGFGKRLPSQSRNLGQRRRRDERSWLRESLIWKSWHVCLHSEFTAGEKCGFPHGSDNMWVLIASLR